MYTIKCIYTKRLKDLLIYNNKKKEMNIQDFVHKNFETDGVLKSRQINVNRVDGIKKLEHPFDHNDWDLERVRKNQPKGNTLSIYLKHIPNLYCIDFDKAGEDDWNSYNTKTNCELYNYLVKNNVAKTTTYKGEHYLIYIKNCIEYTNQQKVGAVSYFEIDLLKGNNVWETLDRTVEGQMIEVEWSDISRFFNLNKMNKSNVKNRKKKGTSATSISSKNSRERNQYHYNIDDGLLNDMVSDINIDSYDEWFKFTCLCKELNQPKFWDKKCKEFQHYDRNRNCDAWDGIKTNKTPIVEHFLKENGTYGVINSIKMKKPPTNIRKEDHRIGRAKLGFDLIQENTNYIIKSDTGTGKTTSFREYIKRTGKKFISVVSRINLGWEQYRSLSEDGVSCEFYQNVEWFRLSKEESVITTIDSLEKMNSEQFDPSEYVFFFDEFQSLIEYIISADTMRNKRVTTFNFLIKILENCQQFIGVDADVKDICFALVDGLKLDYTYIRNTFRHNRDVETEEVFDIETQITLMKRDLDEGQMWFCCCDSLTVATYIHLELKEDPRILLLTSDSIIDKINLDDYEYVIYSPKVIYGLDAIKKRNIYCVYKEHTISPCSFIQQICRCRNILKLSYFFDKKKFVESQYEKLEDVRQDVELCSEYGLRNILDCCRTETNEIIYNKLFSLHYYTQDCLNTNKYAHFRVLLKERGFKCKVLYRDSVKTNSKVIAGKVKQHREEVFDPDTEKNQNLNRILKLPAAEIESNKELFLNQGAIQNHFNISRHFFKESSDVKYDLQVLDEFNSKKTTTAHNRIVFLGRLETEFKFEVTAYDKINIDIPQNPDKKLEKDYYCVFQDRRNNPLDFSNKYDIKKLFVKIYKHLFGKSIITTGAKERVNGAKQYQYSLNKAEVELNNEIYKFRRPKAVVQNGAIHLLDED